MAELSQDRPLTLGEQLLKAIYGEQGLNDYSIRQAKAHEAFASQPPATDLMNSPIPGGNPEVPTGKDALVGMLMSLGAGGIPAGISRQATTEVKPPSSRTRPSLADSLLDVYHGTRSNRGIRPEPGLHVGTPEQASSRIRDPLTGDYPEGSKIYPLQLKSDKIVDIKDLGNAMDFPGNLSDELLRVGTITPAEKDSIRSREDIFNLLQAKGIDALRYPNKWEGSGYSYQVVNPKSISGKFSGGS